MDMLTVISIIAFYSTTSVSFEDALSIAKCESHYGKYQNNWEGSSAKGVYMFTDKTWKNYCEGDVMNVVDNVKCFYKLYPKHKSWWKCKA